jgi:molybdenum cofactor cytidylyltransferase
MPADAAAAGEVWAVVLAAGSSSRLGRPKQLLELGGEPLVDHVLRTAAMSRVEGTVVVLGHAADAIGARIGDFGQRTIVNPDHAAGQSTSLRAGLVALPPSAAGALVLLTDQPLVTPALVDRVIAAWEAAGGPSAIAQARYGDVGAPPVLIGRSFFSTVEGITGDQGARDLIRAHRDRVVPVSTDEPEPLDVDTEDDLRRLSAAWEARRRS